MTANYFDHLVGPLKRAAIDAYMKSHSGGHWQIQGDKYVIDTSDTDNYVTRPGADGEGGGDWETDNFFADLFGVDRDDEFMGAFNDIRSKIDDALGRWRSIPDGSDLSTQVEAMRQANRRLSVDAVHSDGTVTGGGEIGGNINLILENSDAMGGGMITAFKSGFLAQLSKAIGGHHAITVVLGGHLAAQQAMWVAARETVVDIIDSSTTAFNAAAQQGDVDWRVVLKVIGHAVAGATIFAGDGGKKALGVAGLGLTILDGALSSGGGTTDEPQPDYESVMGAFIRDLDALDEKITDEEKIIRTNITDNLSQIRSDKGSYDLSRPPLLDVDEGSDLAVSESGETEELKLDYVLVKEITNTYLPNVADELSGAMGEVDDSADLLALHRDSSIGVASNGVNTEFHELRYLLWELLGNLASEVSYSAKTLELAVADIRNSDDDSETALREHSKEVEDARVGESDGAPYDPWNVVLEPNL